MSNSERLRKSLAQAMVTMDWLQAIACAREILELEPSSLGERHLLAQLYLRVSGSRLATVQLQKVLHQAARSQKLWKAVAAQKCLEGCNRGGRRSGEYASILTQVAFHSPALSATFDQLAPEAFELVCREMELVPLIQNERWTPPEAGRGLLIAAWGRVFIEGPEEPFEIREDHMRAVEPGSGGEDFSVLAMEETELLIMGPEALSRLEKQSPAFAAMVQHGGLLPADSPASASMASASTLEPSAWMAQPDLMVPGEPEAEATVVDDRETHLIWEMWKEFREKRA